MPSGMGLDLRWVWEGRGFLQIVTDTDEDDSLTILRDVKVFGVEESGLDRISLVPESPEGVREDSLHLPFDHAGNVLHDEYARPEPVEEPDKFPEELVSGVVKDPAAGRREPLARGRTVKDRQFAGFELCHIKSLFDAQGGDVPVEDRNMGKIELEGLNCVIVPFHRKPFLEPGHGIPE